MLTLSDTDDSPLRALGEFRIEGLPANDSAATPVIIVERSRFLVP